MSDFVEDLTIQSLQRKLKTAMEIADSATIIVLEREKQIKELEQQLRTANGRSERLYVSLQKTISITNKLLDEKAGILFFDLADTRDIESVLSETENSMVGKPIVNSQLLEAAKTGANWMRWWLQMAECECEYGHTCGYTERKNELEAMDATISDAEEYANNLEGK